MFNRSIEETQIEDIEIALQELKSSNSPNSTKLSEIKSELSEVKVALHNITDKTLKENLKKRIQQCDNLVASLTSTYLLSSSGKPTQQFFKPSIDREEKSLATLRSANQQLIETEQVGTNIITHKKKQKDTIQNTQKNLEEINSDLSHSNSLLNRMSRWWRH